MPAARRPTTRRLRIQQTIAKTCSQQGTNRC